MTAVNYDPDFDKKRDALSAEMRERYPELPEDQTQGLARSILLHRMANAAPIEKRYNSGRLLMMRALADADGHGWPEASYNGNAQIRHYDKQVQAVLRSADSALIEIEPFLVQRYGQATAERMVAAYRQINQVLLEDSAVLTQESDVQSVGEAQTNAFIAELSKLSERFGMLLFGNCQGDVEVVYHPKTTGKGVTPNKHGGRTYLKYSR